MPGVNSRHWDRIIDALAGGPIVDPSGLATQKLMEITGHESTNALAKILRRMEMAGVVERDINGRRTTRIALTSKAHQLTVATAASPVAETEVDRLRRRVAMLEEMVEMLLDRLGRAA